jgi:hypothetical protein
MSRISEKTKDLRVLVFTKEDGVSCSHALVFLGCSHLCFLSFYNSCGNALSWMMEAAALMGYHHDQWRGKTPSFAIGTNR